MVKTSIAALIAFSLATSAIAGTGNFTRTAAGMDIPSAPAAPAATSAASGAPAKPAQWTLMVFANGKNNLEPYAIHNFKQMESIGSNETINIVVELGRYKNDTSNGAWTGCRRYLVQKSADPVNMMSPALQTSDNCDMGDYREAIDFGKWAMLNFPARHYIYVIMNHGGGWTKSVRSSRPPNPALDAKKRAAKGISYDTQTNNHINTPQLAQVLRTLGHVDVFASDACLMQMAEVDAEIKPYVDYIAGSEETSTGYTYDDFIRRIMNSDLSGNAVAKAVVESYGGDTQSYLASASLDQFGSLLTAFAKTVMDNNDKAVAKNARDTAQKFEYADNKDLYDFVSRVVTGTTNAEVKTAGTNLLNYISGSLIRANKSSCNDKNSNGIAIYIPDTAYSANYNELTFAKTTNWPIFIQWLLQ